jgi:cytochrome P450
MLVRWTEQNSQAIRRQDHSALSQLAREFEAIIDGVLEEHLRSGASPEDDVTAGLMHDKVWGRSLSNEEIASVLRNWTVGEIGSIASAIGILAHFLAQDIELQHQLRAQPALLPAAIDEILRIHGPLVCSRRIALRDMEIAGRKIAAGERVTLHWIAANRDGDVFEEPETFRWDRDTSKNLLYGAGIHVCPGAPLARLEMRVAMEELLSRTALWEFAVDRPPVAAVYPASGFSVLPLRLEHIPLCIHEHP